MRIFLFLSGRIVICVEERIGCNTSQPTLTMFLGVMALRYLLIDECHNSHKHSQSPLTNIVPELTARKVFDFEHFSSAVSS